MRDRWSAALLLAAAGAWLLCAQAAGAGAARTDPRLEELRLQALGPDWADAEPAIRLLQDRGAAGRDAVAQAVRKWLERDRETILRDAAAVGDAAQVQALENEIVSRRTAACANIARLGEPDTMRAAREHHVALVGLTGRLNKVYATRSRIFEAVVRRKDLLGLWQRSAPSGDAAFTLESEAALLAQAEQALGISAAAMLSIPEFGRGLAPRDAQRRLLWLYRACRRIEAYNDSLKEFLNAEEYENVQCVNAYRECLGLLPYEVDPRLVQSARRHSKEMFDLKYFSHWSPVPENYSHVQRIRAAGYHQAYAENLVSYVYSGRLAFSLWFASPGHHQSMASGISTAIGVGKWFDRWTQHFGYGPRLMPRGGWDKTPAKVLGEVVAPQKGPGPRPPIRRRPDRPEPAAPETAAGG